VQSEPQQADQELLALAAATRRTAESVAEPAIRVRLREIADELTALARGDDCAPP